MVPFALADNSAGAGGAAGGAAESTWQEVSTSDALSAALSNGGNIKLTADITVSEKQNWAIEDGKTVVLDLNSHSITSSYGGNNNFIMTVSGGGSLTVTDNSQAKTGKIAATHSTMGYGIQLRSNGSFTLLGGTIETTQETVDIYTNAQNCSVTIAGGKLVSTKDNVLGVRGESTTVNIFDGEMESAGRTAVYISNYGEPDSIQFTMTGGSLKHTDGRSGAMQIFNGATVTIAEGAQIDAEYTGLLAQENVVLNVTGGTIEAGSSAVSAEGQAQVNISGGEISSDSNSSTSGTVEAEGNAQVTITGGTLTSKRNNVYIEDEADATVTGGTFKKGENTDTDVQKYFPEGAALKQDDTGAIVPDTTVTPVAEVNNVGYADLQYAINAATDGQTIVLLQNIDDLSKLTTATNGSDISLLSITKNVTIDGNGYGITITMPDGATDRSQAISVGSETHQDITVTFDDVDVTINGKGTKTDKGDAIDMWATLNITNGSTVTMNGVANGFVMQGGMNAKVNVSGGSSVKADGVSGHFSNGGVWSITDSTVNIANCGTHGLSVETVKIDNSTVTVGGAKYTGLYGTTIEIVNGANVTVQNCGTSLAGTTYADKGVVQLKAVNGNEGTLTVTDSTLTLTGNSNGAEDGEQSIYIGSGNLANTNSIITGTLVLAEGTSSHVVTFMSEGQQYTAHVVTGTVAMPTAPTRPGYAFLGWSDGSRTYQPGETATISGDTTFTALWQYIPPADPSYQITIPATANGTVTVSPTSAKEDQVVTITVTPNSGYELTALTVTDRSGNRVTVTANPDGTYRFVMPASQVTVSAVFAPAQLPFTDVTEANWYYDEVYYVWANGLMQGTSATTFGPNVDTTRAMVVTILWRLEGEPASGYDMDYSDVAGGAWYAGAVRWATEHGIVNGSEGQFYPGGTVTREQLAAMLYRYAQYKGYDLTAGGDLSGFADAGAVSGWAETSLAWAVGQGLLQGSDSQVDPQGSAIRAQTAAILMRFCENTAN